MTQPASPHVDLPTEQRAVLRQSLLAFAVCAPTLALASLGLPRVFSFPETLSERLAFGLRADLVIGLWVILGVRMVAKVRFESEADNAGSAYCRPSPRIAVPRAFLQNTLEQAFTAAFGILALATVEGEAALAYIAAMVVLFSLGRATFLRGYPRGAGGRAFGIATTALPTIGAYGWALMDTASDVAARLPG
ncbi:MAPEG family protein [Phenylobacterium sp. 58.2.17]|uniref:MAPEG family protein n=1 Tax=Phenylobacterium sp. 58.2.17 TaxID=2969306 RepID=UPI0022645B0E|nr:MAPEG family protein [Phenylobacterium sp. 58.2.17]MCX7586300.1 MAPEG family protein [Phenylobacterium sp. 58.2.17]